MKQNRNTRKILLFGGSGLVGSRVKELFSEDDLLVISPSHQEVDLTADDQIIKCITEIDPDYIIYAAGLTKVDVAELDTDLAHALNAKAPDIIAQEAKKIDCPVCYLSTDAVFDGEKSERPYKENDQTNPKNVYGVTKRDGENVVLAASSKNIVLRLVTVYSANYEKKKDFCRIVIEVLKKGEQFPVAVDQVLNPTFVDDAVKALKKILDERLSGIYHVGSIDYISNYEFAKLIARKFDLDTNLVMPISLEDLFKDKPAKRCRYCWLDTSKFRKEFGEGILHTVDEGLDLFKSQLT